MAAPGPYSSSARVPKAATNATVEREQRLKEATSFTSMRGREKAAGIQWRVKRVWKSEVGNRKSDYMYHSDFRVGKSLEITSVRMK